VDIRLRTRCAIVGVKQRGMHPVANKFEIYDGAQVDIAYVTRHMAHYVKTWRHPQNRKYITYCVVVREMIEPRQQLTCTLQKISWRLGVSFVPSPCSQQRRRRHCLFSGCPSAAFVRTDLVTPIGPILWTAWAIFLKLTCNIH